MQIGLVRHPTLNDCIPSDRRIQRTPYPNVARLQTHKPRTGNMKIKCTQKGEHHSAICHLNIQGLVKNVQRHTRIDVGRDTRGRRTGLMRKVHGSSRCTKVRQTALRYHERSGQAARASVHTSETKHHDWFRNVMCNRPGDANL